MGDLFGSSSTTTTTSEPFSGATKTRFESLYPYLYGKLDNAPTYSGELSAPMSGTQHTAINYLSGLTTSPTLSSTLNGDYLTASSNPYIQDQAKQITDNYKQAVGDTIQNTNDLFNKSSFWGGSAQQNTISRQMSDAEKNLGNSLSNLYYTNYNNERNNQMQALNTAGSLGNSLMSAGNTEQNVADTADQRAYAAWLQQQGYNQDAIQNLLNYFNIGKNPTQTSTTESGGMGDILGSVAGGWAARGFKWK